MQSLIATLIHADGSKDRFLLRHCPIYVTWADQLYARQPGGGHNIDSTYRPAGALVLDPAWRVDNPVAHAS
jgi:hypothetical protein